MTRTKLRILPTLIVAMLALVVGVIGTTSVGNAAAAVTKSQVKKIANKAIAKAAPTLAVASATTATTALGVPDNAINSADIANGSVAAADLAAGVVTPVLWARVSGAGVITSQNGNLLSAVRNSTGNYTLTFNRNVNTCAATLTVLDDQYVYYAFDVAANQVLVDIENTTGTQTDARFNIIIAC